MIAFSTIIAVALVIGALRLLGENQQYSVAPHPLLEKRPLVVAWGGDSTSSPAFTAGAYAAAAKNNFLLGVDLRLSFDGVWYVYPDKYLKEKAGQFVTHTTSEDLDRLKFANSNEPIMRFDQLIKLLPQSQYYVVIENPASIYLEKVFLTIEAAHIESQFILSSPFADTTKFLRERNAKWITDSTTAETAKSKLLASLFLEPLITTTGEVMTLDHEDSRLMREMRKRHLAVLLRSDDAAQVRALLKDDLISGVVTSRPSQFLPH